eukprot:7465647-Lingulodinium_polyedra.AAC.1
MNGRAVTRENVLQAVAKLNQHAMDAIAQGHRAYPMTTCDPQAEWPNVKITCLDSRISLPGPGATIT